MSNSRNDINQHWFFKPKFDLAKIFHLAVHAETPDIKIIVGIVEAHPELLLQPINEVTTRGGVVVKGVTLYQFFIGEGDPDAAKKIELYFEKLPNGEHERIRQYEPYQKAIEQLKNQIELKQSAYDLEPLIALIIHSPDDDIKEAINKKMSDKNPLKEPFRKFIDAVNPKIKKVGELHYEHYTTIMQVFDLLVGKWQELKYINNEICDLVWQQLLCRLQLILPAINRFAFAQVFFKDEERITLYKFYSLYGLHTSACFPDYSEKDALDLLCASFDRRLYGRSLQSLADLRCRWKTHVEKNISSLENLWRNSHSPSNRPAM